MLHHLLWVSLLFVKCVTCRSASADCVLMNSGITMHFLTHHRFQTLNQTRSRQFPPHLSSKRPGWHGEIFPQEQKSQSGENPDEPKVAVKRRRRLPRSLHDISESPQWNGSSNSGIWRSKQTQRHVITNLISSSARVEDEEGDRPEAESSSTFPLSKQGGSASLRLYMGKHSV